MVGQHIEATDQHMDSLVCELYGLEEPAIVRR